MNNDFFVLSKTTAFLDKTNLRMALLMNFKLKSQWRDDLLVSLPVEFEVTISRLLNFSRSSLKGCKRDQLIQKANYLLCQ